MKTAELTGAALDWAVAKCERLKGNVLGAILAGELSPSTQWHYAGPIIEREGIEVCRLDSGEWNSGEWRAQLNAKGCGPYCRRYGPTPLVAAMRCYVASVLGDTVDIPEELT